ncbi:tetratricopeptide repeat protein [Oleiharenicola lentus]|uniref:Tetratricopeptide repeat protein n=1 Tax=Oleiharenicola lentus TaxID=2508720 RepID=A0A4V1M5V9_9BACT|nr:tetratricopeptide repeat protein [Oleiharenicola lentus]RXK52876.1 tetratricopeptide repeat protein [Oleiharenicola lentus]
MLTPLPSHGFRAAMVTGLLLVLTTGCTRKDDFAEQLKRGDEAVATNRYDDAEKIFMDALVLRQTDPQVIGRMGILYYNQGQIARGYAFLEEAVKGAPNNADFQLHYALACYSVGKTIDARKSAQKALEQRPKDEVALLLLAETCVSTRDNEETRRIIEDLRTQNGEAAGYYLALGALRRMQRDYAAAEKELDAALALNPQLSAAHDQMGMLYAAQGDNAKAAVSLKTAAQLAPPRATVRLRYVNHLIRTDAREEAKKEIASILAQAPDCIPALILEAKLAADERRLTDAATSARKVIDRDRTHYEALTLLAAVKFQEGDFEGGIARLKEAEEHHPRAPQIKMQLAAAHLKKGERLAAEDYLKKTLLVAPNHAEATQALAELQLQKGDAIAAAAQLEPLVKARSGGRRTLVLYAQACFDKGDEKQGLTILRSLVAQAATDPDNHYLLGRALLGRDRPAARQAIETTVRLADKHWSAQEILVDFDLNENRTNEAASRIAALIEKYPGDPAPLLLRARIRIYADDLNGAEADLLKALELDPSLHHAYYELARIYFVSSRSPEALEKLTASAAQSNTPRAYTQLGMLQTALGKNNDARKSYEQALALDRDFPPALNNLAMLLSKTPEDLEQAAKLARRAHERLPADPHITDTLGWILFRQGQHAAALPYFRSAAEKRPADAEIQHHLAMTLYCLEQEEPARLILQRLVSAKAEAALVADAHQRLAVLAIDPERPAPGAKDELQRWLGQDATDPVVLARLGVIEAREGDPKKAAELLESALKSNPRSVSALLALLDLYAGPLANPGRAQELAKAASSTPPADSRIPPRLGRYALRSGDFAWAASLLQDAARQAPDDMDLRIDHARALYGSGRVKDAESTLAEVLKGNPSSVTREAARRMSRMLSVVDRREELPAARVEADQVLSSDPSDLAALMIVAADSERLEKYREAERIYGEILARLPGFAPAIRKLALLQADFLGDDKQAEELAQKARRAYPDDPELSRALGSISYRRGDYQAAVNTLRQSWRQREDPQTAFLLGVALFGLKNTSESRTFLERALQLKLPAQETTEAERILREIRGNRSGF